MGEYLSPDVSTDSGESTNTGSNTKYQNASDILRYRKYDSKLEALVSDEYIPLPKPSAYEVAHEKVWGSNTGRNTSGLMIGDFQDYKYTVKCSWSGLSKYDADRVYESARLINLELNFMKPNGQMVSRRMYSGTPTFTMKTLSPSGPIFDVKLDYIEV